MGNNEINNVYSYVPILEEVLEASFICAELHHK